MRRIDVLFIGLGVLSAGGLFYWVLGLLGVDSTDAGLWTQAALIGGGIVIWVGSYLARVLTGRMTFHEQLRNYEEAVIDKRLETMSPEELKALQEEIEAERQQTKS